MHNSFFGLLSFKKYKPESPFNRKFP